MARARSSLPVPDAPVIRTDAALAATWLTVARTAGLCVQRSALVNLVCRAPNDLQQLIEVERLGQVVIGASSHGFDG